MTHFDEVQEAQQLFQSYLRYGRVFVGIRRKDGHYDVEIRPVEDMKLPAFRYLCEFWGVERHAVEKTVSDYNDQLVLNRSSIVAQEFVNAMVQSVCHEKWLPCVKQIAFFLRKGEHRMPSDIPWLVWRLQKIAEWGDHAGFETILDSLDQLSDQIIIGATRQSLAVWQAAELHEAAEALQPA